MLRSLKRETDSHTQQEAEQGALLRGGGSDKWRRRGRRAPRRVRRRRARALAAFTWRCEALLWRLARLEVLLLADLLLARGVAHEAAREKGLSLWLRLRAQAPAIAASHERAGPCGPPRLRAAEWM